MPRRVRVFTGLLVVTAFAGHGARVVQAQDARARDARPSFDCRKATLPDERTICADDHLARMDRTAAKAFGTIGRRSKETSDDVLAFLKERHGCGTKKLCILENQTQLIEMLDDAGAKVPVPPWVGAYRLSLIDAGAASIVTGLPTRVGSCTRTKIAAIGTRFSTTPKPPPSAGFDEGSSVGYTDDGVQISYTYNASVAASIVGDEVVLCLVSLPKDCPPGDDRGKIYSSTNLRTKGSWIMPDSQHMCGGA